MADAPLNNEDGRALSPSRPFIVRPVATTLLMTAIMLSGLVAFSFLPVAALPEVDYPTIQVQTFYPGASPEAMSRGHRAAEAPVRRDAEPQPDVFGQFRRGVGDHPAVQASTSPSMSPNRRCRPRSMPPATCCPPTCPRRRSRQGQPRRRADSDAGIDVENDASDAGGGLVDTRLAKKISQLPGVGLVSISGGQRPAVRIRAESASSPPTG